MQITPQTPQTQPKISPFLWFDTHAEDAARFYTSTFPNSALGRITHYEKSFPQKEGSVMTVSFTIYGQHFIALNGGAVFSFTPAISFFVLCEDQQEVDDLWQKLTADGGQESQCGWLKDKFGVSWQIVPKALFELLNDTDPGRAHRVTQAMLGMRKIDVETLRRARDVQS